MEFLLGVISSLVASVIVFAASLTWSKAFRERITDFLLRGSGGALSRQWPNRKVGEATFLRHINQAKRIDFLGSRGQEFQLPLFEGIMVARPANRRPQVRVLLPSLEAGESQKWIAQREKELSQFDKSYVLDTLATQIKATEKVINGYAGDGIQHRHHCLPHFGRIVLTEDVVFVIGFSPHTHGYQDPMSMHEKSSPVYRVFERLFNLLWNETDSV